jgi:hypothetical protein
VIGISRPQRAARFVAEHREAHGWIPQPVRLGVDLSLSAPDLARLYALGTPRAQWEERDARLPLPELADASFRAAVRGDGVGVSAPAHPGSDARCRSLAAVGGGSEVLERSGDELLAEFSDGLRRQAWRPYAITAGIHGGGEREVWERLIAHIDRAVEANSRYALVLDQRPQLSPAMPVAKQLEIATQIGDTSTPAASWGSCSSPPVRNGGCSSRPHGSRPGNPATVIILRHWRALPNSRSLV